MATTEEIPQMTVVSKNKLEYKLTTPNLPIDQRMSALFDARQMGNSTAVELLIEALKIDKAKQRPSILFQHEVAYVLGQIGNPLALSHLISLLEDENENEMVRHEAAEALAAIGSPSAIDTIKRYTQNDSLPVKQTCELALKSLITKAQGDLGEQTDGPNKSEGNPFLSVDPTSAKKNISASDVPQLKEQIIDESLSLWDRYEALFSLRNIGTPEAIESINTSLEKDKASALFRHEAAFVLGQIQSALSADALINCLENSEEHSMARHESALAMGSIAASISDEDNTITIQSKKKIVDSLFKNLNDTDTCVYESCEVALKNICEELGLQEMEDILSHKLFSQ